MKPIANDYLERARSDLDEARKILAIGLPRVAARSAYFAVFHAAEAYIFEKLNKAVKTHAGVHIELARALRVLPDAGKPLLTFLSQAYRFKEIGDYIVDPSATVTSDEAESAVAEATRFVEQIAAWLNE